MVLTKSAAACTSRARLGARAALSQVSGCRFHPSSSSPVSGFTLVEVMMAATVIVFAFFGMIQAVTVGSEMMATARRQTLASKLMDHELEQLRLQTWATISGYAAGPTTISTDSPHPFYTALQGSGATFTLTRTVADASGLTNVKEITFTVTWTVQPSGGVAARTYTRMKSGYYGKYGLNLTYQRS